MRSRLRRVPHHYRWDPLTRFVYDGGIEIDNNAAERSLGGVALGRKKYLFAGSADHPINRIEELLPWNINSKASEVST